MKQQLPLPQQMTTLPHQATREDKVQDNNRAQEQGKDKTQNTRNKNGQKCWRQDATQQ
jgi:hypothetical protein